MCVSYFPKNKSSYLRKNPEILIRKSKADICFFFPEKSNSGMLKFTPEDQNQDKWNEFVSDYILKCDRPNCVAKNLNW